MKQRENIHSAGEISKQKMILIKYTWGTSGHDGLACKKPILSPRTIASVE